VAETKTSTKASRLVNFEFSTTQAYVLEFGDLYVRFFTNNGRLESPPGTPVEVVTPYTEAQLPSIKWAQSADVLYLVHPSREPRKLVRNSATSWTLSVIDFIDGPYFPENITATTVTPSATTGSITLTASAALWTSNHVNALWRITHGGTTGYVQITAFTSTTSVTATVKKTLGGITAVTTWREGLWSTERGFPRAVTFFEDRLYFGGSNGAPQRFDGSTIGTYEDFTPGTADDDAVSFSVTSGKVNAIQWLLGARDLLIGTAGEEFSAKGAPGKTITPVSISVESETDRGSGIVTPVRSGNSVLFVQRAGKKLRELIFNFDVDGYISLDASLLAEHLTKTNPLTELAYQQEPNSIVWAIRADGVLLGLVYDKAQDVTGWSRHSTEGLFESVAVIPHPDGDRNQLWTIANRTIGGATKRYVEFFDDVDGSFYPSLGVDSGLTYSGVAVTTLSGLSHLEGKTVAVMGNGFAYPNKVVSGGQITGLDPAVTTAEVGLAFTSILETLSPATPTIGLKKHRANITVSLHETLGCTVNDKQQDFRSASDPMDLPVPPFTGDVDVTDLGWDRDRTITVKQTQPLPCDVVAISGILETAD
jgi:hypothetical protein